MTPPVDLLERMMKFADELREMSSATVTSSLIDELFEEITEEITALRADRDRLTAERQPFKTLMDRCLEHGVPGQPVSAELLELAERLGFKAPPPEPLKLRTGQTVKLEVVLPLAALSGVREGEKLEARLVAVRQSARIRLPRSDADAVRFTLEFVAGLPRREGGLVVPPELVPELLAALETGQPISAGPRVIETAPGQQPPAPVEQMIHVLMLDSGLTMCGLDSFGAFPITWVRFEERRQATCGTCRVASLLPEPSEGVVRHG